MKKLICLSFIAAGVGLAGMFGTGCKSVQTSANPVEARAISHNPIAHLSDLVALTNSLPGTKRVAYFAIEMNDQTTQPFAQDGARERFPMWTDILLKCSCTNDDGTVSHYYINTVGAPFDAPIGEESVSPTVSPYVSVEIPAVYNNTPDTRFNVRINPMKYSSIAHFLYANGKEGAIFDTLAQANSHYKEIKSDNPEYGKWYNVFQYAPKSILLKVDLDQLETQMFHNENNRIHFSYNRRVGSLHFETAKVGNDDELVWTPIFPRWVRTSFFNEFAKGDIQ